MEPWHIWIIIGLVFFIIEMFTSGFAVACFSFGAVGAAIVDICGGGVKLQLIIFAVVTFLAFLLVRPVILKVFFKNDKDKIKTGVDALIGRQAKVSETINDEAGTGRVAVDGDDWKAVSEDGSTIEKGTKVQILAVNSVILTVKKI